MKKSRKLKAISLFFISLFIGSAESSSVTPPCSSKNGILNSGISSRKFISMSSLPEKQQDIIHQQQSALILFGRHGTTESNTSGVTHSRGTKKTVEILTQTDPNNIIQLAELRKFIGKVYCSSDDRCKTTARIVSEKAKIDLRLNEHDLGSLSGAEVKAIVRNEEFRKLFGDPNYRMQLGTTENGETQAEVVDRILNAIADITEPYLLSEKRNYPLYICSSSLCMADLLMFLAVREYELLEVHALTKNYYMLPLRYYPESSVIELIGDHPISPEEAVTYVQGTLQLENEIASRILQEAKDIVTPASSPVNEELTFQDLKPAEGSTPTVPQTSPKLRSNSGISSSPLSRSASVKDLHKDTSSQSSPKFGLMSSVPPSSPLQKSASAKDLAGDFQIVLRANTPSLYSKMDFATAAPNSPIHSRHSSRGSFEPSPVSSPTGFDSTHKSSSGPDPA